MNVDSAIHGDEASLGAMQASWQTLHVRRRGVWIPLPQPAQEDGARPAQRSRLTLLSEFVPRRVA